jgi:CheY-like chemotaxis protein
VSLLGRLEDLSLTDIIQIVFLSRRTGILEIIDPRGRHAVVFQQGLIVNASSPMMPDIATYLETGGALSSESLVAARQAHEAGVPLGTAILDMNLVTAEQLSEAILSHVVAVVSPLLHSREGEFNFILSDSLTPLDIEYEPTRLFKEGGIAPARILGEGEKVKPLAGLEESMRVGKELLRGRAAAAETSSGGARLDLGFHDSAATSPSSAPPQDLPLPEIHEALPPEPEFSPGDEAPFDLGGVEEPGGPEPSEPGPFAPSRAVPPPEERLPGPFTLAPETAEATPRPSASVPAAKPAPAPPPLHATAVPEFRVTDEKPAEDRLVILHQRDPLLRVSARRAFSRKGISSAQYGAVADTRREALQQIAKNRFFVTFLDIGDTHASDYAEAIDLLEAIKRKNHHLPVVAIDRSPDLRRRHELLRMGVDLYLTKPSDGHLQPGMVEEQLALFADELVLFAQRAFEEARTVTGGDETGTYRLAGQEKGERSSQLLMRLINELNDPNDINQVSQTVLRLASQYLNRGVIFAAATVNFVGLGGFGVTGDGRDMNEKARSIRIARAEPSILRDVVEAHAIHRGKLRKSSGNVRLIEGLGNLMPSEVAVLPVLNKDEVVGILYGDNAENRAPIDEVTGLEIFLSQAGFALRNAMIANRGRYGLE